MGTNGEGLRLEDVRIGDREPNKPFARECTFVEVDADCRVYFRPWEPGAGFHWVAVEWCSGGADWPADKPLLDDPECEVDVVCSGVAYWDGLRHMWWGGSDPAEKGYLYYPSVAKLQGMLKTLRALEQEHCRYPEHE